MTAPWGSAILYAVGGRGDEHCRLAAQERAQLRDPSGHFGRTRGPSHLRRLGVARAPHRAVSARGMRLPPGRPRRVGDEQLPGISRAEIRDLACRAHRRAGQREAPPQRVRLYLRALRHKARLRDAGPRDDGRQPRRRDQVARADHRHRHRTTGGRSAPATASTSSTGGATIPPGSSTPRAPPGGRKARRSRIATS